MALSAFQQAFADARKSGDKTFEFNGKQYTTQLKEEAPAAKTSASKTSASKAGPSATPSAGSQMGPGSSSTKDTAPAKKESQGSMSIGDTDYAKSVRASQADGESGFLGKRMREAMGSSYKKGGSVKKMAKGGSASSRADGCAQRGKTRGMML
jgi:hypothetical protein